MEINSGSDTSGVARSRKVSSAQWEPYKLAFSRLTLALQSGNLNVAKLAYASLGELQNPRGATPLAKIGKALENNNNSDAQTVMRNLLANRPTRDTQTQTQTQTQSQSQPQSQTQPFRVTAYASTGALINTTA